MDPILSNGRFVRMVKQIDGGLTYTPLPPCQCAVPNGEEGCCCLACGNAILTPAERGVLGRAKQHVQQAQSRGTPGSR